MEKDNKNNWYVITGTLSSGKTTVINRLKEQGYRTIPELARVYIDAELAKGRTIEDTRKNKLHFQHKILQMKVDMEKTLPKDEVIFFDRGVHDSIAYYKLSGLEDDGLLNSSVADSDYAKVFLLDMVEYKKDYARVETDEERRKIQHLLIEAYAESGLEVINVPVMETKEERAKFILSCIGK